MAMHRIVTPPYVGSTPTSHLYQKTPGSENEPGECISVGYSEINLTSQKKYANSVFEDRFDVIGNAAIGVVGTLLVHAFVNDEELTALDRNKGVAAEGTAEDHVLFYRVGIGKETVTTDLAEKLTFVAVVFVEVDHGSAAARTADILRNVAGLTTVDRLKILAILPAVVL